MAYSFFVQNTPLHAAASKGHQKIVELLVEHGANVHSNFQYKKVSCLERDPLLYFFIVGGCEGIKHSESQ